MVLTSIYRLAYFAFFTFDHLLTFIKINQRWSPRGRPWPRGRPRGHILKSLALASKP